MFALYIIVVNHTKRNGLFHTTMQCAVLGMEDHIVAVRNSFTCGCYIKFI